MNNPTNKIILTQEQEEYLRENFATVINYTLCKNLGICHRTLVRLARARGLVKDMKAIAGQQGERITAGLKRRYLIHGYKRNKEIGVETRFKPGYKAPEFFGDKYDDMRKKQVEARKRTFAEERARVAFGLPQRTKLHVKRQPMEKVNLRYYLKSRGYILDESQSIAYWTETTQRATKLEARPRKYYTFKQWKK